MYVIDVIKPNGIVTQNFSVTHPFHNIFWYFTYYNTSASHSFNRRISELGIPINPNSNCTFFQKFSILFSWEISNIPKRNKLIDRIFPIERLDYLVYIVLVFCNNIYNKFLRFNTFPETIINIWI